MRKNAMFYNSFSFFSISTISAGVTTIGVLFMDEDGTVIDVRELCPNE